MSSPGQSRSLKRGKKIRSSLRIPSATVLGSGLLLSTAAIYAAESEPPAEPIRLAEANPEPEAGTDNVLATVVVQARNRLEPLKDVPLSISVVQGNELQRLQAEDLGAITRRAANVSWNQGNQRTSSVSIRGVGKVGQTEAQDPSVGIIVDGVSYAYNPLSSSYNFIDVDTVEVTRGPQGTLMGKSASLGVVSIRTKRPTFDPTADYSVSYGDDDALHGWFAGGGGIIDDVLAWRTTLSFDKAQGDISNRYNPDNTYQNKDRVSGRLQFLYTPTEDFSARISVDAQPRSGENTNGRTFYTPTPALYADGVTPVNLNSDAATRLGRRWFTQKESYSYSNDYLYSAGDDSVYNDAQQPVVTGTNGAALEASWRLGNFDVTSITAYRDYRFNAHNNDEGTPFDIQRSSGQEIDYEQRSQELRVNSQFGELVDYQAGIYLLRTETDIRRNVILGADAGAWFATPAQYTALDADGNGRYLMQNSLDKVWKNENLQRVDNKSAAIFGQANWHFTDDFTLTTGLRFTREDRSNPGSSLIFDNGNAPELNPYQVNGVFLGGFDTVASGALGTVGQLTAASALDPAQVAVANRVAQKYFNVATYAQLNDSQRRQVAYAKAIRQTRLGVLWNYSEPEPYKATQPAWVLSPSYKLTDDITTYVSWQYGEKAGVSQQVNGRSFLADAEESNAYEWGVKSILLDNTLTLNFDVFYTEIKNYQQSVQVFDEYTTALRNDGITYYIASTGNAPKVEVKGVEIDGVYAGLPNTTLRFAGAYNDAKYKEFGFSGLPPELGNQSTPYQDVSGEALAGAPKYTFNIGADFRIPLWGRYEFHSSANWAYASKFNSDNTLSSYGWIPATSLVDLAVGLGTDDGRYDLTLLAKNVLDDDTPLARTWNTFTPATSRWFGVMLTGKLF
jgi:outer membrane receptor protein involved in Fe transport